MFCKKKMSYARPKLYGFADGRTPPVISDTRRRVKLDHFAVMPDIRSTPIDVEVKTTESGKTVVVTSDPSIPKPEVVSTQPKETPAAEPVKVADPAPKDKVDAAAQPAEAATAQPAVVDQSAKVEEPKPLTATLHMEVPADKPEVLPVDISSAIKEPVIVVPKTPVARSNLSTLIDKLESSGARYQIKDLNPALAIAKDSVNPGGLTEEELDAKIVDEAYRGIVAAHEGFANCNCSLESNAKCSVNLYDSRYMSLYDADDTLEKQAERLVECAKKAEMPRELPYARLCRETGVVLGVSMSGYGVEY